MLLLLENGAIAPSLQILNITAQQLDIKLENPGLTEKSSGHRLVLRCGCIGFHWVENQARF